MSANPGSDAIGKQNIRVPVTRAGSQDGKFGYILNTNRVKIQLAVGGNGASTTPVFVLRAFFFRVV